MKNPNGFDRLERILRGLHKVLQASFRIAEELARFFGNDGE